MKRFCCLLLLFLLPAFASAEELTVEMSKVKGFTVNEILICSPAPGQLSLSVATDTDTLFAWTVAVPGGESSLSWNGLGYHNEVIPEGTYRMVASLATEDGQTVTAETPFTIAKCQNALLFALPKSDTIYTGSAGRWHCEMQLARPNGTIVTEFYRFDDSCQLLGTKRGCPGWLRPGCLPPVWKEGNSNPPRQAPQRRRGQAAGRASATPLQEQGYACSCRLHLFSEYQITSPDACR